MLASNFDLERGKKAASFRQLDEPNFFMVVTSGVKTKSSNLLRRIMRV